jgi:outer membrane protein TolC
MLTPRHPRQRGRIAAWVFLPLLVSTMHASAFAQAPEPSAAPAGTGFVRVLSLNLAQCLDLAMQRQPRLAAQRASLAAAQDGLRALENLQAPAILAPELPVRRKQAALGVTAAMAGLQQAEQETIYAVTRTYLTVLYARGQERVARGVVDRLTATRDAAKRQLDAGARDVSSADVSRVTVYLRLAETKQVQASQGVKRAAIALREAIGLGCEVVVDVPVGPLPAASVQPVREQIVAQAAAHRGELARAGVMVEATCLEIRVQAANMHRRVETFAAGADIHGVVVPQGIQNNEYRPGALPPEMPTLLAGTPADRARRAQDFNARAAAVAETTANLIVLEAEDAYLRFEEASLQLAKAREAADVGDQLAADLTKDFAAGLRVKTEEVINARVLAAQARSQYNEQLYRQLLALADLERITGGGFSARLVDAIAGPSQGSSHGQNR